MLKIDFYILSEGNAQTRFPFACRLIEKAYRNQHRIYVHTENQNDAHFMDELLWTYKEDSFLPHHILGEGPEPAPPIQIGVDQVPAKQRDIMLNLGNKVPSFFTQFSRILEIVPHDTEAQTVAREKYRHYRSCGYDINTHKLQTVEL